MKLGRHSARKGARLCEKVCSCGCGGRRGYRCVVGVKRPSYAAYVLVVGVVYPLSIKVARESFTIVGPVAFKISCVVDTENSPSPLPLTSRSGGMVNRRINPVLSSV